MSVELNHTIIPTKDKWVSAKFLADILNLEAGPEWGHFVPVKTANGVTSISIRAKSSGRGITPSLSATPNLTRRSPASALRVSGITPIRGAPSQARSIICMAGRGVFRRSGRSLDGNNHATLRRPPRANLIVHAPATARCPASGAEVRHVTPSRPLGRCPPLASAS